MTLVHEHNTGTLYVLDADIRRRKPDAIIEDVITFQRKRNFQWFGMETNQFQKFLSDKLQRRSAAAGVYVPVTSIQNTTDKLGRIQRLQPLISSGRLRFSKRHITLLEQLRQFPWAGTRTAPMHWKWPFRLREPVGPPPASLRHFVRAGRASTMSSDT